MGRLKSEDTWTDWFYQVSLYRKDSGFYFQVMSLGEGVTDVLTDIEAFAATTILEGTLSFDLVSLDCLKIVLL